MTTESKLEEATQEVAEVFNKFAEAQKQELLEAVGKALQIQVKTKTENNTQENKRTISYYLFLVALISCVIGMIAAAMYLALVYEANNEKLEVLTFDTALKFMAFVVALASYLASVARETVKKLDTDDTEKRIKNKKHIFYMLIAEASLIFLSLFATFRFFTGPRLLTIPIINKCITFDSFLMSFLTVILICMAILHMRIWCLKEPWWIYKKRGR